MSVDAHDILLSIRPGYHEEVKRYEQNVPDVSDKLRRIDDGNSYPDIEPIDLYLLGEKGGKVLAIGHENGEDDFRQFILHELARRCNPNESLPEAVFIRKQMQGTGNIPPLPETDLNKYLLLRMGIMIKPESRNEESIGLINAVYCVRHGIPLLSAESKAEELAKRAGCGMDCFMASIAAPDISEELAELRKSDTELQVPSIAPVPKKGIGVV